MSALHVRQKLPETYLELEDARFSKRIQLFLNDAAVVGCGFGKAGILRRHGKYCFEMTKEKKQSFRDEPEWYKRWHNGAAYWCMCLVGLIVASAQNAYKGRYAQAYAWASPFIITGMAYMIERLSGRSGSKSVSCMSVLIAIPLVGLSGYLIFGNALFSFEQRTYRNPTGTSAGQLLVIASAVVAAWLLIMLVGRLTRLHRLKSCSICGQPTGLTLIENLNDKRFCREHFREKLQKAINEYNGKLIIVEQDPAKSRQGQYVFYEPDELTKDSYPQSDVQSVKRLIDRLLSGETFAAKIPNASVKDIGSWDENPLLVTAPDRITVESLDKDELLLYLEHVTCAFDDQSFEFQMNLPHGKNGIYLWHNYV